MSNGFDDDLLGGDLFDSGDLVYDPLEDVGEEPRIPRSDLDPTAFQPFSRPAGDIPAGTIGSISYDRGDNEIVGGASELGREAISRPRVTTGPERDFAERRALRERTDTGNRNTGRATAVDSGSDTSGTDGEHASSIGEAGVALRHAITNSIEERPTPTLVPEPIPDRQHGPGTTLPTGELDDRVRKFIILSAEGKDTHLAGGRASFTSGHGHTTVSEAPALDSVEFDCEVYGVKLSNAGDWMVTVKVPNHYGDVVTSLSRSIGLNLKTRMESEGML